jgi:predicted restriction endonuclease
VTKEPLDWCDAHHIVPWSAGGSTNLSNLILLCRHHHRLVHRGDWEVRMAADELPESLLPATQDPARHPRRNRYHRRT